MSLYTRFYKTKDGTRKRRSGSRRRRKRKSFRWHSWITFVQQYVALRLRTGQRSEQDAKFMKLLKEASTVYEGVPAEYKTERGVPYILEMFEKRPLADLKTLDKFNVQHFLGRMLSEKEQRRMDEFGSLRTHY